jgi:glycylpeptide N-tetradecanoyltransferase
VDSSSVLKSFVELFTNIFRFDYSVDFLRWALTPPGFMPQLHVGVRSTKSKALMGCITGIPSDIQVYETTIPMVEINFLCVHKKLRTKRLAPVLIKEVTRRVNLTGRWQATYTAGVVLPKPVGRCRYWHRSLNPKKLIEVRFSAVPAKSTLAKHIKDLKLPDRPAHPMRPMQSGDVPGVHALLADSLKRYGLPAEWYIYALHVGMDIHSLCCYYY